MQAASARDAWIALLIDDIYTTGQPLRIRAQCQDPMATLVARVTRVGSTAEAITVALRGTGGLAEVSLVVACPQHQETTIRLDQSFRKASPSEISCVLSSI